MSRGGVEVDVISHNTLPVVRNNLESNIVAFLAVLHLASPRGTFAVMHDDLVLVLVQFSDNFYIAILVVSHIISVTP